MSIAKDCGFDTAVLDKENLPVALVEVKTRPLGEQWRPWLLSQLKRTSCRATEFLMAIDPQSIQLFQVSGRQLSAPVAHLDTPEILSHYDPDFTSKRIFEPYLLTLVEAWLRDLAYHWKSPNPPGSEELKATGFLGRVEGGTTEPPGE